VVNNVDISERNPLENDLERYIGLDHIDPESLHIKRWGLIEEGTSFTRKFIAGQVLFGKRRAYQRKVAIAEFDGICSGDILVFEAKDDLLPELLPFIVQSDGFYEHALGTSAGSLSPRTRWRDLADYEFALPPKDEQRRIADILWAVDDMKFAAEQVEIKAKNAFVLACQQLTSGPNHVSQQGWRTIHLSKCVDILDYLRRPLNQEERSTMQGNIPYYGANGPIDFINDFVIDEEVVLIGEDGDHFLKWDLWPQAYLVRGKSWVNNHAHVLRAKNDFCSNRWLYRFFQHRNILSYLQDSASMTRRKLTKSALSYLPMHIPSQEDQNRLLNVLDQLDGSYQCAQLYTEKCSALYKEVLASVLNFS